MTEDQLAGRVELWNSILKAKTPMESLTRPGPNSIERMKDAFEKDLSFGTAGLRAPMGPGFNRMNMVTIQLASQGVAEYLQRLYQTSPPSPASSPIPVTGIANLIIIGHDHRHNSVEFAQITAKTMKKAGLKPLLIPRVIPTPLVPFTVRHLGALFGIMITASHNPAADNGYKVYAANGCQIVSPMDKQIAARIKEQNYSLWSLDELAEADSLSEGEFDKIIMEYLLSNQQLVAPLLRNVVINDKAPKIVYTPMHGVGGDIVTKLLSFLKLPPLFPVASQFNPNADFPTVALPNPEEGEAALMEGIQCAEREEADYIFANDPDADRFNCAERQANASAAGGVSKWRIFTGNELATLFVDFLWRHRASLYPADSNLNKFAVVASCVSSKIINAIGKKEGFLVRETLTGFKHISNEAQKLEAEGSNVFFAFEEAIGFMANKAVWDKDGISALLLMRLLLDEVLSEHLSVSQRLESIYCQYGYFASYNSYFALESPSVIGSLFMGARMKLAENIPSRKWQDCTGPCQIAIDDECTIFHIQDYPSTPMITLQLSQDGLNWITLRASGTEPKIKFYSELRAPWAERAEAGEKLRVWVTLICQWLLDAQINNLHAKN